MIATLLVFALGLIAGLLFKGINITINHKESVDKPVDTVYNSSFGDPEVRQYLDQQYKVGDE